MEHIPDLSNAAYVGLCLEIGTATEVRFRRETLDTACDIKMCLDHIKGERMNYTGSYREGFRFLSSDTDIMSWHSNYIVICDISQIKYTNLPQQSMFLMDCSAVTPGYTKLRSIQGMIIKNDKYYFSSSLFRKFTLKCLQMGIGEGFYIEHGPCSSFIYGDTEIDLLTCLKSDFWPYTAQPWIQRCIQTGWPSDITVNQIVNSGFHLAPIASSDNDVEWRISFSDAEQKIIYSFNHCQFLCYGLLKIFLKEVISVKNSTSPMCSYFLKTAMFWVIQNDKTIIWRPNNLLHCFWNSFKLLVHWIYTGYCPNFFIPENNMFKEKVTGYTQSLLFEQMYDLYNEGIQCILRCTTIQPHLKVAIEDKMRIFKTNENSIRSTSWLEQKFFENLVNLIIMPRGSPRNLLLLLNQIELLLKQSMTPHRAVTIQYITAATLHKIAMSIQDRVDNKFIKTNRDIYLSKMTALSLLKVSCNIGTVSEMIYLAMYHYRNCQHEQSIMCLNRVMIGMRAPYTFFSSVSSTRHYECALEGMSLSRKMKKAVIDRIVLRHECTYINELVLEQKMNTVYENSAGQTGDLRISPLVMLYMLLILNSHKLGVRVMSVYCLHILQTMLLTDNREYESLFPEDIHWQMLGICQQICGYHADALRSFLRSLKEEPFHRISRATCLRMLLSIFLLQSS